MPGSLPSADEGKKAYTLHVYRSTKGRAGKVATLISGFPGISNDDLTLVKDTATTLRQKLGTGGSYRDTEILLQGDRCNEVAVILRQLGFRVK